MNEDIIIKRIDTLMELENKLGGRKMVYCDEYHNMYAIINIRNSFEFGIAYADYGIDLMFGFDDKNDVCYIGAGQNLSTVILDVINIGNDVYVLCDLELICYSEKKEKWSTAFREMVTNYELLDNERLWLDCDGRQLIINLQDGTVV